MIERDLFYYRIFIVIFWIEACFGFVSEELLPFEGFAAIKSPLFFLFDIILVCIGLTTLERKRDKFSIAFFVILAFVSTVLINKEGFVAFVNGSRQFIGILFFVPIFRYLLTCNRGNEFREKIDRHLFRLLCVQAVCVTEQFIRYGANDHGGGSLGFGGSGIASTIICALSFYLISKKWDSDNYLRSLWENRIYIFLLYPVFLNETKISFIYLALYFLLLYKFELKSVGRLLIAAPIIVMAAFAFLSVYKIATNSEDDVTSEDYMTEYLLSSDIDELVRVAQLVQDGDIEPDGVWDIDMPRFAKISLMPSILEDTQGGNLFGAGLGQFKGGTTLELTKFATEYRWAIQGSVPMIVFVYIQLGLVGFIWFMWQMFSLVAIRHHELRFSFQIKFFLLALLVLCLFYNDMFQSSVLCWVFFFIATVSTVNPKIETPDDVIR